MLGQARPGGGSVEHVHDPGWSMHGCGMRGWWADATRDWLTAQLGGAPVRAVRPQNAMQWRNKVRPQNAMQWRNKM